MSGLDIQVEKSEYEGPQAASQACKQKICCRWQNTTIDIQFFFNQLILTNGLVVMVSSRESGDMGSIPDEC